MSGFDYFIGILLSVAGIWLLIFVLRSLLNPLLPMLGDLFVRRKFEGRIEALGKAVDHIDQGRVGLAQPLLRKAFFTRELPSNLSSAEQLHTHNLRCLEAIVRLQKIPSSARKSLAQLESAVVERGKLLRAYVESSETFKAVQKSDKNTPDWAKTEFENKFNDCRNDLKENQKDFERLLEMLFKDLEGSSEDKSEITYH